MAMGIAVIWVGLALAQDVPQDTGASAAAPAEAQAATVQEVHSGDSLSIGGPSAPEYYVVQDGDTLWDISSKFLGNAYYWPRLWSINEQITNPHWIYPGNRIRFTLGTLLEPPEVGLEGNTGRDGYTVSSLNYSDVDSACGPDIRFTQALPTATYQSLGFLASDEDVDILGHVPHARSYASELGEGDLLYLTLDNAESVECGDVLLVFREMRKKIRHPTESRKKLGNMYRVVGEVKVVHRSGKYVSAIVRTSYSEIERGDLIGPVVPTSVQLDVQKPKGDVEGTIVARLTVESDLAATGETVFLDRGRADGLRVGSSLYVVDQKDLFIDSMHDDTELPTSVIGRVVVVRVDEYTSTAVVTDAAWSIDTGNRVTAEVD